MNIKAEQKLLWSPTLASSSRALQLLFLLIEKNTSSAIGEKGIKKKKRVLLFPVIYCFLTSVRQHCWNAASPCGLLLPEAWQKLNPADDVVVVTAAVLPKTEPPCPKVLLCPNTGGLVCPNNPPPVLGDGCPKEKELALLVLAGAPNTLPLLEAAVEAAG